MCSWGYISENRIGAKYERYEALNYSEVNLFLAFAIFALSWKSKELLTSHTMISTASSTGHTWRFFRTGGIEQVKLDTAADIQNLRKLDQKLWVALSCPVKGLEFDEKTLALIDTDNDGRVRVPEILAAVDLVLSAFHDPATIIKGGDTVQVSNIKNPVLLASVKQILANSGVGDSPTISLAQATDTAKIFGQTRFNGDGVITVDGTTGDVKEALEATLTCLGSVPDRSGHAGVDTAKIEAFFAELAAYDAWQKKLEAESAVIMPLGDATPAALTALQAVRAKVEDYFARCRVAAYDARATGAVNRAESEYLALAAKDMKITADELAGFPLARVEAGKKLNLKHGINPAWQTAMNGFVEKVVHPILGNAVSEIGEEQWAAITAKLAPFEGWLNSKSGAAVEKLGLQTVRRLLASNAKAGLLALVAEDKALEPQINAIGQVERVIRYQRDLYHLLCNFVNFVNFYHPTELAIFQAGTLYLDSRACELCVKVADAGKHAALAGLAKSYLVYCDCTHQSSGEKMTIAAALTNGDGDNIMVGRNGIFYDRKGRDWDATVTKIIENPISIREAFWSPYKKFLRFIEEQVAKRAAAADAASTDKLAAAATTAVDTAATGKPAAAPAVKPKFEVGTVAALGVGLGAIGTLLGGFVAGFIGLGWWMPLGILGIILAISGPSMLIAALKLRQRNMGPILDANGWAINGRVKINIPFGAKLTEIATLPPGSELSLTDPYAERKVPWVTYFITIAVLSLGAYTVYKWVQTDSWWFLPKPEAKQAEPSSTQGSEPAK